MICEKCGKEHDGSYGSGRFCSRSCANSRTHSEDTKKKIGKALKGRIINLSINRTIRYCKLCEKQLDIRNKTGYCHSCYSHLPISKEQRQKQSDTMKAKNYPRWNIRRNEPSYAERFWMTVLNNNNISYEFEYHVKNNKNHFYILDFHLIKNDAHIDLEIDGKQHQWEDRKAHDGIRDEYLQSIGYIVYRIDWNDINSDHGKKLMKEKIDNFLKFYHSL